MLKSGIEKFKRNFVTYLLIFIAGSLFGSLNAYYIVGKDCAVMYSFRIGDFAYSCKRLAP
jgi:hypothetical protein